MNARNERREQYLALRRTGMGRGDAARAMGLNFSHSTVQLWERWFEAEGGAAEWGEPYVESTRHRRGGRLR